MGKKLTSEHCKNISIGLQAYHKTNKTSKTRQSIKQRKVNESLLKGILPTVLPKPMSKRDRLHNTLRVELGKPTKGIIGRRHARRSKR